MLQLSSAQAAGQVARLRDVRGDLAHAYGVALTRWMGDRTLMALGLPHCDAGPPAPRLSRRRCMRRAGSRLPQLNRLRALAGLPAPLRYGVLLKRGGR